MEVNDDKIVSSVSKVEEERLGRVDRVETLWNALWSLSVNFERC